MNFQSKSTTPFLNVSQIVHLKKVYQLTEIEIRTYLQLNFKYRKNAMVLFDKLLKK